MNSNTLKFLVFLVLIFALGLDIAIRNENKKKHTVSDVQKTVEYAEEEIESIEVPPNDWGEDEIANNSEDVFVVVEQMPRFPGCEDIMGTNAEKSKCAEKKLFEFIYKNLKYPSLARVNGIEGTVIIRFIVAKDGTIESIEFLRDIGAGCGEEGIRIMNMMNDLPEKWTPGMQGNKPVKVELTVPIRFKLED